MKLYDILIKYLPIIKWGQNYKISYIKNDVVAGLTVGLTLIPQGLAYGSLAGLQPQYGLFTGLWGPFIYFFLGTSKDLTIGPTAILSLLVAYYVQLTGINNDITYSVILALFAGGIQLLLGLSKLGFIANYMSPTVVSGFTSSAAITIAWGQVVNIFGLKNIRNEFFFSIYDLFSKIKLSNFSDLFLGLGCLIFLLLFKILFRFNSLENIEEPSRIRKIAHNCIWFLCIGSNIIVIILSSVISISLERYGFTNLSFTDKIEGGLPKFELPQFNVKNGTVIVKNTLEVFKDIGPGIPIITFIALVEAMAIGKSFARKNGYKMRSSQEFIAIGLSNIVGSLFQAFPSTGSFSRTAINSQCSSKSPFSGVITGILVILSLKFLTPYFVYIPKTSLAALIIVAVLFMTDFRYLFLIWKLDKYDFSTWILTFVLSLGFGVEYGVLSGVAYSFLPIILNASQPKFEVKQYTSKYMGSHLYFPFCSRLMAMVDLTDLEENKYTILNILGVYDADSAIINTIFEMSLDHCKRKKTLIVLADSKRIVDKFSLKDEEDDNVSMRCFGSLQEAASFYESYPVNNFLEENLSLLSSYQDVI